MTGGSDMTNPLCDVCNEPRSSNNKNYCSRECAYTGMASVRALRGNPRRTASSVRVHHMIAIGRFLSDPSRLNQWTSGAAIAEHTKLTANRIVTSLKVYMQSDFMEITQSLDTKGTIYYRAIRPANSLVEMVGVETMEKARALFK